MDAVERSKVRGARDMLRECAKQLRSIDATGRAELADRHADQIDSILPPRGQGAIAEDNIMYAVLAVHFHAELLAACQEAVAAIRSSDPIEEWEQNIVGLLAAAIAKAEGI